MTWKRPVAGTEQTIPGETNINTWRSKPMKGLTEATRMAWDISPSLAAFLPIRYVLNIEHHG